MRRVLCFSLCLLGCYGNEDTPLNFGDARVGDAAADGGVVFANGLAPLLPTNMAAEPTGVDEAPTLAHSSDGGPTIHLRARLNVPFRQAWNALVNPQSYRDPNAVHGFRIMEWNVLPQYTYSYRMAYVVHNVITVEYQTTHAAARNDTEGVRSGIIRWQKTNGTTAISSLEGTLLIHERPGDTATDVEMLYRVNAVNQGHNELDASVRTMFMRFTELAHEREPNPNDCGNCAEQPSSYRL